MYPPALRVLLCAVVLVSPALSFGEVHVDITSPPPGLGTKSSPYASIQYAIDAPGTKDGDLVVVWPGVYTECLDLHGKTLVIRSNQGRLLTTLSPGPSNGSVVSVRNGEGPGTTLWGFTITQGTGTDIGGVTHGGGLFVEQSHLAVVDCEIRTCDAAVGGAVYGTTATLSLTDTRIAQIQCGGGVVVDEFSDLVLAGCTLEEITDDCFSGPGLSYGAVHAADSIVAISECTFEDNRAYGDIEPEGASGIALVSCAATIEGTTLQRHGDFAGTIDQGPALVAIGGSLTLRDSVLSQNRNEYRGGAVAFEDVTAVIEDCVFANNSSWDDFWGGAIYISGTGAPNISIRRCEFTNNRGGDGGAIYSGAGTLDVEESEFFDNRAYGLYFEQGHGGAIFVDSDVSGTIERSVFAGNVAHGNDFLSPQPGRGGAIRGPASVVHCTLVDNDSTGAPGSPQGGGVFGCLVLNSVLRGNTPNQVAGTSTVNFSLVEGGYAGFGNIQGDPLFWDEAARDFHLVEGSPCIDAGAPFSPPDKDGSIADMGAYMHERAYCGAPRVICVAVPNSIGCIATVSWTGSPTLDGPDDFHVIASGVTNRVGAVLIWSLTPATIPLGGGTLCVGGQRNQSPYVRAGGSPSGIDCTGTLDFHVSHAYMASGNLNEFDTVYAQFWFRDHANTAGHSVSGALRFRICVTQ